MSKSGGLKLSVRGPGSTGYRIEAVSVEQLQDIQHPLECSGGAQVCTLNICSSEKASYNYGVSSLKTGLAASGNSTACSSSEEASKAYSKQLWQPKLTYMIAASGLLVPS